MEIKNLWYDDNGDMIVETSEDKVLKFSNPVVTNVNLGGRPLPSENPEITIKINFRDDK